MILALAAAAGCVAPPDSSVDPGVTPGDKKKVSAAFVGTVDPARGTFIIRMFGDSHIGVETGGLFGDGTAHTHQAIADEQLTPQQDSDPSCNTLPDTVDLVTHGASVGSGTCESSPGQPSWGGQIRIGNYNSGYYLCNVWVAFDYISDPNHEACDPPDTWPAVPGHLPSTYGAIYMGHTFIPHDGTCPVHSTTGYRRWQFKDNDGQQFQFHGHVYADRQTTPCGPESTIEGITFNEDASHNGYYHIPPDPIGVVGKNHVVSVVNTSIEVATRAGVPQSSTALATFFSSLSPQTNTFDPKVIYDQYAERFVVVTLEREYTALNDPSNTSRLFLAVSATSDPTGAWRFTAIDAKETISSKDHWVDYPGFAVGTDAVYITGQMFSFEDNPVYGGGRLWIIAKGVGSGGFYDGGTAAVNRYDPPGTTGSVASVMQPAHMFGTPPTSVGTFLVTYSGLSSGGDEYLSVYRVDNPLGSTSFTQQYLNVGNIDNTAVDIPNAPQSGTSTEIETNDRRTLNAVWRDDSLWTTATLVPPSGADSGEATAHWWELDTTTPGAVALVQQGNIGGEDLAAGTYTFFPSIMVDRNDNVAIGFSASAATIYPGAYFTGRLSTDAAGTTQGTSTLAAGVDYYIRTFGGSRNRWGDYSGISLDPSGEEEFWVFNKYALTRGTLFGGEDGRWGTRFGSFYIDRASSP